MSALDETRDRLVRAFGPFAAAETEGDPAWLATLRREALAAFRERGLPTPRDEEWRYTSLQPLTRLALAAPSPAGAMPTREELEELGSPLYACSCFVFVNGRYAEALSVPRRLAGEARVESLARLRREEPEALEAGDHARGRLGDRVDPKQHPFAALNTAFLDDGALLRVPEGRALSSPVHLVFVTLPAGGAADEAAVSHPRVRIELGAQSRATVIQDHVSLGDGPAFTNALSEVDVGRGARLDLVLLQRENAAAVHVSGLHGRVARDGRLVAHTATLGGRLVRNDLGVLLSEEGAECDLLGLFLGTGDSVLDNHTLVDHAVPHGTSRELYKGILADRSRGVFRGRVLVRPDAQKTDATQSNPNLLLSDAAEIDTKPQLEIHANDVRCSHGSAIGQLDPEALFYLRTRGLGEREARRVLTRGFAHEVTARLPGEALTERVDEILAERLRLTEDAA